MPVERILLSETNERRGYPLYKLILVILVMGVLSALLFPSMVESPAFSGYDRYMASSNL